jgi:KDO2-lipid IV(A) lauroyltransferase
MTEKKGILFVTGHLGNWELAGSYVASRGIPLDAVVRRQTNPMFDRWLNETRARIGMTVVPDSEAVRRIPRSLRQGRAIALVADQGVKGLASTFVPFFGRPAKTPRGPAVFALRFDAPVLFATALRQPSGKYRFFIEPVPVVRTGDTERDVDETVAAYTRVIEAFVRRYPEQYLWQHRRWRRQPEDTPAHLREPV